MRNGADARAPSARAAYKEMLLQCARDYPGLPDPRTMSISEIVFFYDGLRAELMKHTRPKPTPAPARRSKRRRNHGN